MINSHDEDAENDSLLPPAEDTETNLLEVNRLQNLYNSLPKDMFVDQL